MGVCHRWQRRGRHSVLGQEHLVLYLSFSVYSNIAIKFCLDLNELYKLLHWSSIADCFHDIYLLGGNTSFSSCCAPPHPLPPSPTTFTMDTYCMQHFHNYEANIMDFIIKHINAYSSCYNLHFHRDIRYRLISMKYEVGESLVSASYCINKQLNLYPTYLSIVIISFIF